MEKSFALSKVSYCKSLNTRHILWTIKIVKNYSGIFMHHQLQCSHGIYSRYSRKYRTLSLKFFLILFPKSYDPLAQLIYQVSHHLMGVKSNLTGNYSQSAKVSSSTAKDTRKEGPKDPTETLDTWLITRLESSSSSSSSGDPATWAPVQVFPCWWVSCLSLRLQDGSAGLDSWPGTSSTGLALNLNHQRGHLPWQLEKSVLGKHPNRGYVYRNLLLRSCFDYPWHTSRLWLQWISVINTVCPVFT